MLTEYDRVYGSKYMSASNIDGNVMRLRMGKVETTTFEKPGEPPRKRALIWFEGEDRALVLNNTNASSLAYAYGKPFDDWIGNTVEIRREMVNFAGKMVPSLRVYPVRAARLETRGRRPVRAATPGSTIPCRSRK